MDRRSSIMAAALAVVFLLAGTAGAQSILWEKRYGEGGDEVAWEVIEMPDSGFFVAGQQYTERWRAFLARTQMDGTLDWLLRFGDSLVAGSFVGLVLMPDSGIVAAGGGRPPGGAGRNMVIRWDKDYNIVWQVGIPGNGDYRALARITNGDLVGCLDTFPSGQRTTVVHRIDPDNGDVIASILVDSCKFGYDIINTSDGGWLVTGEHKGGGGYVGKFTTGSALAWEAKLQVPGVTTYGSAALETSGGYIIAGYGFAVMAARVSNTGNVDWISTYMGGYANGVCHAFDGGYILTGQTEQDAFAMHINATGDSVWTTTFGDGELDWGYNVIQTADSNYVVCGEYGVTSSNSDAYLVKIGGPGAIAEGPGREVEAGFSVRPNPSFGRVSFTAPFGGPGVLTVRDAAGRAVVETGVEMRTGEPVRLATGLAAGTYFVEVKGANGREASRPFVVTR